jgi:hypothetical protein
MSIESLQAELASFARERDWEKFHSIRNLTLALVGEVGSLAGWPLRTPGVNPPACTFSQGPQMV